MISNQKPVKKKPQKITDREKFLMNTVDALPIVFYAKDSEGKFLVVNQAFSELLDVSEEDVVGKTNHEIFPLELADSFRTNDLQIIQSKTIIEAQEIKQSIFEAFFTTKDVNQGTGIGLSLAHNIMIEHQGQLSLEDRSNSKGASFIIRIPKFPTNKGLSHE